jgi:hypothetical protein
MFVDERDADARNLKILDFKTNPLDKEGQSKRTKIK